MDANKAAYLKKKMQLIITDIFKNHILEMIYQKCNFICYTTKFPSHNLNILVINGNVVYYAIDCWKWSDKLEFVGQTSQIVCFWICFWCFVICLHACQFAFLLQRFVCLLLDLGEFSDMFACFKHLRHYTSINQIADTGLLWKSPAHFLNYDSDIYWICTQMLRPQQHRS